MKREHREVYQAVGRVIREAREAAGLTQGQLGQMVGYTRISVGNLEHGITATPIDRLIEVARVLGFPPYRMWEAVDALGGRPPPTRVVYLHGAKDLGPVEFQAVVEVFRQYGATR